MLRSLSDWGWCQNVARLSAIRTRLFAASVNVVFNKRTQFSDFQKNSKKKWKFKTSDKQKLNSSPSTIPLNFIKSTFFLWEGRALISREINMTPTLLQEELYFREKEMLLKYKRPSLFSFATRCGKIIYDSSNNHNIHQGFSFSRSAPLPMSKANFLQQKRHFNLNRFCHGFHNSSLPFKMMNKNIGNCTSIASASTKSRSDASRGWLTLEGYRIYPWSISGLETCVVVKAEHDKKLAVAFDLGYTTRPSIRCQHVFISHGHMDHVSGLFQHATKRNLYNLPPAVYYVPPDLVETLHKIGELLYTLSSTPDILRHLDIRPIQPGDRVLISPDYEVRPFDTIHRVRSQGYLVYRRYKRLKPLFQHVEVKNVQQIVKEMGGEESVYDVSWFPELAYTGDTTFEVFLNDCPVDLLKVRVLILEATYLESVTPGLVHKARERGHTHVAEIIEHAHLFSDIEKLVLIHMSDKYSSLFAREAIAYQMSPALRKKVVLATLAKDRL